MSGEMSNNKSPMARARLSLSSDWSTDTHDGLLLAGGDSALCLGTAV